ncbi:MAG: ferritin family protein [Armatimonadota bacterium]
MSIQFSVDEIFDMAERIERNGAKFYRRAAEIAPEEEHQKLLLRLAAMEDAHEQVFVVLRADLPEAARTPVSSDAADERAAQVQAMADAHVFDVDADLAARLEGKETMAAIIEMAIGIEKDTVVFYVGMRDMVPVDLGRDRVEDIIQAEMSHIAILSNQLSSLGE